MSILPRIKIKIRGKSLGKLFLRMGVLCGERAFLHGQETARSNMQGKNALFGVQDKQSGILFLASHTREEWDVESYEKRMEEKRNYG